MISTFPKLSRKQKQKSFQIFIQPISSVVVIKVLEKEPTLFALCNMYGLLPNNPLSELSLLMRNDWVFKTDILTQSPTNYKKHNGVFLCRTFTFQTYLQAWNWSINTIQSIKYYKSIKQFWINLPSIQIAKRK